MSTATGGSLSVIVPTRNERDALPRLIADLRSQTRRPTVLISARRFAAEGTWTMNLKWIGIELHGIVRGEIRSDAFRYFKPEERAAARSHVTR